MRRSALLQANMRDSDVRLSYCMMWRIDTDVLLEAAWQQCSVGAGLTLWESITIHGICSCSLLCTAEVTPFEIRRSQCETKLMKDVTSFHEDPPSWDAALAASFHSAARFLMSWTSAASWRIIHGNRALLSASPAAISSNWAADTERKLPIKRDVQHRARGLRVQPRHVAVSPSPSGLALLCSCGAMQGMQGPTAYTGKGRFCLSSSMASLSSSWKVVKTIHCAFFTEEWASRTLSSTIALVCVWVWA